MNKKLLAVAVAGVMMAPAAMADVTTYGRIVTFLDQADNGTDSELQVGQNTSRIGFKGAEDLGGGLQMIYTLEFGADSDGDAGSAATGLNKDVYGNGLSATRQAYAGIKGDFGAVKIGNIWSPYYLMVNSVAQVLDGAGDDTVADAGNGGLGLALSSRQANSITYDGAAGPAKFTVMLGGANSDIGSDADSFNVTQVAASFPAGPVQVGVGYASVDNGTDDGTVIGVAGAYTMDNIKVAAEFHQVTDVVAGTADDDTQIALSGQFTAGMNRFVAVWENSAEDNGGDGETLIGLGFHHLFSKNTRVFVEYTSESESEETHLSAGIFTNF